MTEDDIIINNEVICIEGHINAFLNYDNKYKSFPYEGKRFIIEDYVLSIKTILLTDYKNEEKYYLVKYDDLFKHFETSVCRVRRLAKEHINA